MESAGAADASATVAGLFVYPVKSCQGIALPSARVTPQGLALAEGPLAPIDRQWCVCGEDGLVQDIRIVPKLATLRVSLVAPAEGAVPVRLQITAPEGLPPLQLPLAEEAYSLGEDVAVSDRYRNLWFGRPLHGRCAGAEAADWITRFVHAHDAPSRGERFRIVRFASSEQSRRLRESFKGKSPLAQRATPGDTAAFADCAPLHLLSEESLRDLDSRLPDSCGVERPVSLKRFRPNVLLRGVGSPYGEDTLWHFALGSVGLRQLGPTGRCVIPTTNPESGTRDKDEEPRATLLGYRPLPYGAGPHGGPTLGIWAAPDAGGEVAVGDAVRPLSADARL